MNIEQYVMAYGVEHDRLRALLPEGFESLRPVLRFNVEIRDGKNSYIEFNTAVAKDDKKGWLNIGRWNDIEFERYDKTVVFKNDFLEISFRKVGVEGSCPAEKDNEGCFFLGEETVFKPAEVVTVKKEFCDCAFTWRFTESDASGMSVGTTLPAVPVPIKNIYPREEFTVQNAANIPCQQVLGSYVVNFER